jgi:hypothetical protein
LQDDERAQLYESAESAIWIQVVENVDLAAARSCKVRWV